MPKKKAPVAVFAVGATVAYEVEGEDHQGTILSFNEDGDYEVKDDDGSLFTCEEHELTEVEVKPKSKVKGKGKAKDEDDEIPDAKPKKKGKKAEPEPEPEEEEEEDEDEDEAEEEDEEEEKPAKKKGSRSKVSAFAKLAAKGPSGNMMEVGVHECLCVGGGVEEKDNGTWSAYTDYTVVNGGASDGQKGRRFYQVLDENGNLTEGAQILKGDLETMGLEEDDFEVEVSDGTDAEQAIELLEILFKKLAKLQPWVSIKAVEKKGYINLWLNGLMEDQDEKPELPE